MLIFLKNVDTGDIFSRCMNNIAPKDKMLQVSEVTHLCPFRLQRSLPSSIFHTFTVESNDALQ